MDLPLPFLFHDTSGLKRRMEEIKIPDASGFIAGGIPGLDDQLQDGG